MMMRFVAAVIGLIATQSQATCGPECNVCIPARNSFTPPEVCASCGSSRRTPLPPRSENEEDPCASASACVCIDEPALSSSATRCGGAVSADGETTTGYCQGLCNTAPALFQRSLEYGQCQVEAFAVDAGGVGGNGARLMDTATCFDHLNYGWQAWAWEFGTPLRWIGVEFAHTDTPAACQSLCQVSNNCARFEWQAASTAGRAFNWTGICVLKSEEQVRGAINTDFSELGPYPFREFLLDLSSEWTDSTARTAPLSATATSMSSSLLLGADPLSSSFDFSQPWNPWKYCPLRRAIRCRLGQSSCLQCHNSDLCVERDPTVIGGPKYCRYRRRADTCAASSPAWFAPRPLSEAVAALNERDQHLLALLNAHAAPVATPLQQQQQLSTETRSSGRPSAGGSAYLDGYGAGFGGGLGLGGRLPNIYLN